MDKIPPELVKSLTELGLLESEAKIYVALVMMNHSEVKELIDFLDMSKPNTYESLRSLEEQGLIVAVGERPIVYQAVDPEIGLEMLIDRHLKAKNNAEKLFSTLERETREHTPDEMWYIFTEKNVEYKIRDMLRNANKSVHVAMSDHYVKLLKALDGKDIELDIIILTDKTAMERRLKKVVWPEGARVRIVSRAEVEKVLSSAGPAKHAGLYPPLAGMAIPPSLDMTFMLVVDGEETLYVPSIFGNMNAIHSHGRKIVRNLTMAIETMGDYFTKK